MQIVEPTNSQLMNVLNRIENKLVVHDQKFDKIDQRFESIDQRFESIDQRFEGIDQRFESIDQRFDEMEQNHFGLVDFLQEHMVTKEELNQQKLEVDKRFDALEPKFGILNHSLRDYIDRKIYDLRGDLVQIGVLKRV